MEDIDYNEDHRLIDDSDSGHQPDYQTQVEKIMNFQAITQTSNTDLAAKFLVRNDWDESRAANEYYNEINKQDFNAVSVLFVTSITFGHQFHSFRPEQELMVATKSISMLQKPKL
jgi:hypothetical protein